VKVSKIELIPYEVALRKPVRMGTVELREREGILVRVESARGAVGWGDAAPLPGFSRESLDQVHKELEERSARPVQHEIGSAADLFMWASTLTRLSPSAMFAVESAVAGAAAMEASQSLGVWLFGFSSDRCALSALAIEPPEQWAQRARECLEAGYSTVKFKVGRAAIAEEVAASRAAVAAAPGLQFRFDANRAWSAAEALTFARGVAGLPVEYIEEPFANSRELPAGWPADVRIAWDETLHNGEALPVFERHVSAWVLKPSLVGGLSRSVQLARHARRCGCRAVFSAAYESGVGIRVLAELAATTGSAAGLDTYSLLAEDVLIPRLAMDRGEIDLALARRSVVKA